MKKRTVLFVVTALASIIVTFAYDFKVDGIYYNKVGDDEVSVTKGEEPYSGDVSIPSVVEHEGKKYGVTSIGAKAFFFCLDLTSVNLPEGITSIENDAFAYCEKLSSISLPHSLISVGNRAFMGCTFPTIDIPESVVHIGTGAFLYSELETVVIPNSITCISDSLFGDCYHLVSITIPNSVTTIGKYAFSCCQKLLSMDIPDSVTSIGCGAFWGSWFHSFTLPGSITEIPENLFYGNHMLVSVTIPESVTTIGKQAFQFCESLESIEIPNGTTCIEDSAFAYCRGMISASISKSVAQIGKNVFLDSWSLTSIVVDEGNPFYDSRNDCNALIETASNTLLAGCMNTVIPDGIARIEESAFENCSGLTSIVIPGSVTNIGERAFLQCSALESVSLSDGLTHIEEFAFFGCTSLPSLVVPNSVKSIGDNAFCNCSSLTTITLPEQIEHMGMGILWGCYELTSYTLPENLTTIGDYFFCGCANLSSVSIPNTVTSIGGWAFQGCGVTSVIIPYGVTTIGEEAFSCMSLTSVSIPNTVTKIGRGAFAGCSSMPTITIPSSVKKIGQHAFVNCYKLTFVVCDATTPPEIEDLTFWKYGTLRVPAGSKEAYAAADYWKNFEIIEDVACVPLGNSIFEGSIDSEHDNSFVFSLQDSVLSINGYYTGNPDVMTSLEYTIVGHDIYLNMVSELDEERDNVVDMQPLTLDVAIEGCTEDYYYIYLSGYYGKTAIVDDYTLHETSFKGYGVRGFVREKPPKTDISTGQKDPKEQEDVDVVCRVRGIVGGGYQQRVRSKEGNVINLEGTYNSQAEGNEDVEATTSLGQLEAGEYKVVLNVTDADDVMPPFSATLTFRVGGTGVEVISYDGDSDVIFDLQGNPAGHAAKGLYIVNGKKVIIK